VTCPVLVVHGTADKTIPFSQGQALFDASNSPKQLVRLDGAGHCDYMVPDFLTAMKN